MINDEGLRDWFGKSKSKDGKKGWVNVVMGDLGNMKKIDYESGEGVPLSVYLSALYLEINEVRDVQEERKSVGPQVCVKRRRRKSGPGVVKSGAAKPTMVKTDRKTRKEEMEINEKAKDKKGKGSGKKDALLSQGSSLVTLYGHRDGFVVKCRKKGGQVNWGNSTTERGMEGFYDLPELTETQISLKYNMRLRFLMRSVGRDMRRKV